jgi:hypothetical protein
MNTNTSRVVESGQEHTGRWTREEHEAFLSALSHYGKEWKKVAAVGEHVKHDIELAGNLLGGHQGKHVAWLNECGQEPGNGSRNEIVRVGAGIGCVEI